MLSVNVCGKSFLLLVKNPHLTIPTVIATIEATLAADHRYKKSHFGDNIANGYKHAAWNALIAYYCQIFYTNPEKTLDWAKTITDLHEECFPNESEAKQMDLDNNKIGREAYLKLYNQNQKRPHKKILLDYIAKQDLKYLS
ncbi:MAG: DUF6973 domain-containing protein [Weeksellaceae bacterium]